MSKVFTVIEVAEILKVHSNTVYELIRTNKLKVIKIGNQYRITEEFISDFLSNPHKPN